MNVVLLDDEKHAIENLALAILDVEPSINIIGKFRDPLQAINFVSRNTVDVLFIDFSMPKLNGFDVIEALHNNHLKVVMVTAHSNHTIEAIRKNVFDYLLKPISITDLSNCLRRLKENLRPTQQPSSDTITIKSADKITLVKTNEILFLEADNTYTIFHLKGNKTTISSKSIAHYEGLLNQKQFLRCHNSFLVNRSETLSYLKKSNELLLSTNEKIPVSRQRKGKVVSWLTK